MSRRVLAAGLTKNQILALVSREVRSDVDGGYSYIGVAQAGSGEDAPAWTITRISIGDPVTAAVATGVAWDDRTTTDYGD